MDHSLNQNILFKTTSISPNSIALFIDKKIKAVVSHSKGIHILESPNFDISNDIKLNEQFPNAITCLTVSDQLVFFASGMTIGAIGGNGKTIIKFDTYLANERIDEIHVHGYRLWVISGSLLNEFILGGYQIANKKSRLAPNHSNKTQDVNSHIFPAKINASILFSPQISKPFLVLLLTSNQIICFDKKQTLATLKTNSPPTTYTLYNHQEETLLVGTMSGQLLLIKPTRNKIILVWSIKQKSKGKINCLCLYKNGFIVCRDLTIEFWNSQKELVGTQTSKDRIASCLYINQFQTMLYATINGDVAILKDYQKLITTYSQKNQQRIKQQLMQQIQKLQNHKIQLKNKLLQKGVKKTIKVKVKHYLTINYSNYCYNLDISSEQPIYKIIIKGHFILIHQSKSTFKAIDQDGYSNYVIKIDGLKNVQIFLKSNQLTFKKSDHYKVNSIIYLGNDETKSGLIATSLSFDLKLLSLYQKINKKLSEFENKNINTMKITGNFKYFDMNLWLNIILNDFGSAEGDADTFSQRSYQSILTKNTILIRYKTQLCQIYSDGVNDILAIKNFIILKSKQKNLNFSYECTVNQQSIVRCIEGLIPQLQKLCLIKKQLQLLPGLQQLKDQIISSQLSQILRKSKQIKQNYEENKRKYQQLKQFIVQLFISFKSLKNKNYNQYDIQKFKENIQKVDCNWHSISKIIIL